MYDKDLPWLTKYFHFSLLFNSTLNLTGSSMAFTLRPSGSAEPIASLVSAITKEQATPRRADGLVAVVTVFALSRFSSVTATKAWCLMASRHSSLRMEPLLSSACWRPLATGTTSTSSTWPRITQPWRPRRKPKRRKKARPHILLDCPSRAPSGLPPPQSPRLF